MEITEHNKDSEAKWVSVRITTACSSCLQWTMFTLSWTNSDHQRHLNSQDKLASPSSLKRCQTDKHRSGIRVILEIHSNSSLIWQRLLIRWGKNLMSRWILMITRSNKPTCPRLATNFQPLVVLLQDILPKRWPVHNSHSTRRCLSTTPTLIFLGNGKTIELEPNLILVLVTNRNYHWSILLEDTRAKEFTNWLRQNLIRWRYWLKAKRELYIENKISSSAKVPKQKN